MMNSSIWLAAGVVALLLLIVGLLSKQREARIKLGLYTGRDLMTENELEFFGRLVSALPQYYVFPQVAMSALLEPASRDEARRRTDWLRIAQQRIDYVVCDRACNVIVIVELDDRTHSRAKDKTRDARLEQAGLPTLRFESRAKPSPAAIRAAVQALA